MKKLFLIAALFCINCFSRAQNSDTLYVNYYSQAPFALNDNGDSKGMEIDIINEYVAWLRAEKNMEPTVKFVKFTDWSLFFSKTRSAPKNTMGLGSVTINAERLKEIDFTSGYLKNVSFCITNGHAPEIKTKTPDEIVRVLGHMTALTLTNSTLNKYVNELKKSYIQDLKINSEPDEIKILDEISKNALYFGYVDAVGFWFYLKNNPQKFLKMQKVLNQSKEELGFIMPKGSQHKALFNEFFNGAAGFKKSKNYKFILEKYLGPYMTQTMAVN